MSASTTTVPAGRAVVTGAGGFVGSNVVPALQARGYDVAVIVRPGRSHRAPRGVAVLEDTGEASVLEEALREWRPSVCVHLATLYAGNLSAKDFPDLVEANVGFTLRVANAFAAAGGKTLVYASSFSQRRGGSTYSPTNVYAATKQAGADMLRYYTDSGAFRVVDLQLFDTIGPTDTRPKVWSALMEAAWTGVPLATSEGGQLLSPTHIEDVARALVGAIDTDETSTGSWSDFYITGPRVLTLREAVSLMEDSIGHAVPVSWGVRPYSGNEMFTLWTSGASLPAWAPRIPLEAAFAQMWQAYLGRQRPAQSSGHDPRVLPRQLAKPTSVVSVHSSSREPA